jgi:hypothetical protein
MLSCKLVPTPMCTSDKLSAYHCEPLGPDDVTKYKSVVGAMTEPPREGVRRQDQLERFSMK